MITFLLLRDNKNISPWHSILNNVQYKNLVLHENNFVSKKRGHGVKVGPGLRELRPRDLGTRDPEPLS